jgi:hypothetical protein
MQLYKYVEKELLDVLIPIREARFGLRTDRQRACTKNSYWSQYTNFRKSALVLL